MDVVENETLGIDSEKKQLLCVTAMPVINLFKKVESDSSSTTFKVRATLTEEQIGNDPWQTQYTSQGPGIPNGALVYVIPKEQIAKELNLETSDIIFSGASLNIYDYGYTEQNALDNSSFLVNYNFPDLRPGLYLRKVNINYNLTLINEMYVFTVFDGTEDTIFDPRNPNPYPMPRGAQMLGAGNVIEITYSINSNNNGQLTNINT